MKKSIFGTILGITALLAIFLVGSICNVNNDVVGLAVVLTGAAILSFGYFLGRCGSHKGFSPLDAGFIFLMACAAVVSVFFIGSIANVPHDKGYLAVTVGFVLTLVLGFILGNPDSKNKKESPADEVSD